MTVALLAPDVGGRPREPRDAREVMHLHGTGSVDIRLTRPVIRRLRDTLEADARVDLRAHVGDWVRVRLRRRSDLELATELLDLAIDANRRA